MPVDPSTRPIIDINDTPKFDNPPVVETVIGVQFKPLSGFHITHFGQFHELLKHQGFITVQEVGTLPHQIEQGESAQSLPPFLLNLSPVPPLPRAWFLSETSPEGQQVVQLQNDRLLHNWKRSDLDSVDYTSYSDNRSKFQEIYSKFLHFAESAQLGEVVPDQCEITYVNQIRIARFANPADAYKNCFKSFANFERYQHIGVDPDAMGFSWNYWLEAIQGRLHIQATTASLAETKTKIIGLQITARGTPAGQSINEIIDWLDLGHYFVVNAFADITTSQMHTEWKRQ